MATVIETKDRQMAASSTPMWKNDGLTGRRCNRGGEGYVIISDINDIPSLSAASESITNHRRKKNTGHILWYVPVWVKEDKMCRIPDCFPTLSEAHSLNPVNDYMKYLRYLLKNQRHISAKNLFVFFFCLFNPFFFLSLTFSLSLSLHLQSFIERLAL